MASAPPQVALLAAVASFVLVDLAIVKARKQRFRVPLSAIITGLIIGSVAPISASLPLIVAAAMVAELTKFFIKAKARNVFNPAAVGLLVALAAFGAGEEWWAAPSIHIYGMLVPLAAILVISAYEARRLPLTLVAVVIGAVGLTALSGFGISAGGFLASLLAVNYYFIFLMAADPKTSPNNMYGQAIYGMGIAIFATAFVWWHLPYALLLSLALSNAIYAAFRVLHRPGTKAAASTAAATS